MTVESWETGSAGCDDTGSNRRRIACVGLGFVGYYTALGFCRADRPVVGVDTSEAVITEIRNGIAPAETGGLAEYIQTNGCEITTRISDADDCGAYLISVPTPLADNDSPDLSFARAACRDVATVLAEDDLVVIQSTVYPGCTRTELIPELERSGLEAGSDFGVSHVPERYSPGDDHSKSASRVVGSVSEAWRDRTVDLYDAIADSTVPVSSLEVAEATKLIENTQRDVNIALMNEFAIAAEQLGIDVWEVIAGADTKWNFHRYRPGIGVGGHCIPVDPHYLRDTADAVDAEMPLVSTARQINSSMPARYAETILSVTAPNNSGSAAAVAVLGVTYKPDVRDTRNSASIELIRLLRERGLTVTLFDPQFEPGERIAGTDLSNGTSVMDAVRNVDVVVVATGHESFRELDPTTVAAAMNSNPVLIDPQRTLDPRTVAESELVSPRDLDTPVADLEGGRVAGGRLATGDDGDGGANR